MAVSLKAVPPEAPDRIGNGTIRKIDGQHRVFYDGYWIRHYDVPNTLAYKKVLIDSLTRRVFHHAEPGINTPGERFQEVRAAYDSEADAAKKRVLAAMLAGALMNRGSDILTRIVELEQLGVSVKPDNELVRECGRCFMGALEYGRHTRPVTGREGLDELWGEPFKAFTMSVEQFLETRYIKIALTMRAIDTICERLTAMLGRIPIFAPLMPLLRELAEASKLASETMRSDVENIDIWPRFVAAADRLNCAEITVPAGTDRKQHTMARRGLALIREAGETMIHLANLRVPMPKTTGEILEHCDRFEQRFLKSAASAGND
jgi:hypothetical protein